MVVSNRLSVARSGLDAVVARPKPVAPLAAAAPSVALVPAARGKTIHGALVERLIFNFALPHGVLERELRGGVTALDVRGTAVASFCLLRMRRLTVGRIPAWLGITTTSCAWRFGARGPDGEPAVYVTERYNVARVGGLLPRLGYPWVNRRIALELDRKAPRAESREPRDLRVADRADKTPIFAARFTASDDNDSQLFDSAADYASFIKSGVRSYSPCAAGPAGADLSVVDLIKDDQTYRPLAVEHVDAPLLTAWTGKTGRELFDSAYTTSGGIYRWNYIGRLPGQG